MHGKGSLLDADLLDGLNADQVGTLASLFGCQDGDIVKFQAGSWDCESPRDARTIFLTSTPYTGNLMVEGHRFNGLTGADAICQFHANIGVVPPGTYIALEL